jgi:hypothetical protein
MPAPRTTRPIRTQSPLIRWSHAPRTGLAMSRR